MTAVEHTLSEKSLVLTHAVIASGLPAAVP
jgi:hypothetical protein